MDSKNPKLNLPHFFHQINEQIFQTNLYNYERDIKVSLFLKGEKIMTEEQRAEERQCDCICMSKWFRRFLAVTCGSFVGVFLALCLFHAINKPPMPPMPGMYPPPYHHECRCDHHRHHGDFHKKMPPKMDRKAPRKFDKKDR